MINIPRYKDQDLQGGSVLQLEDDMLTVKEGPVVILPSLKIWKKEHLFRRKRILRGTFHS